MSDRICPNCKQSYGGAMHHHVCEVEIHRQASAVIQKDDRVEALQDIPLKAIKKGDQFTVHSISACWVRLTEEQTNMGAGVSRDVLKKVIQ